MNPTLISCLIGFVFLVTTATCVYVSLPSTREKKIKRIVESDIKKYGKIKAHRPWSDSPEYRTRGGSPATNVNVEMPPVKSIRQPDVNLEVSALREALYTDYCNLISKLDELSNKS